MGFAVSTVGILALGMAATVTAFSVVTHVLWHSLPVPDFERVIAISEHHPDATSRDDLSPGNFVGLRGRIPSLEHVAAVQPFNLDLSDGARPEVVKAGRVTAGFLMRSESVRHTAACLDRTITVQGTTPWRY